MVRALEVYVAFGTTSFAIALVAVTRAIAVDSNIKFFETIPIFVEADPRGQSKSVWVSHGGINLHDFTANYP